MRRVERDHFHLRLNKEVGLEEMEPFLSSFFDFGQNLNEADFWQVSQVVIIYRCVIRYD